MCVLSIMYTCICIRGYCQILNVKPYCHLLGVVALFFWTKINSVRIINRLSCVAVTMPGYINGLVAHRDIHTYKNSYILHKTSIKTLLKPLKPNKNH